VFHVPVVDISPYAEGADPDQQAAVAPAIDAACREVGFIQVTGHGVPDEVVVGLGAAMDSLFDLDLATKKSWTRPAGENRGYTAPTSGPPARFSTRGTSAAAGSRSPGR
jgi:isopenicillin N synthase-like dioxygenase